MNEEEELVVQIINKALELLIQTDEFLLENDVCELSVSHKIASYLERFFQSDCVDVEYNKVNNNKKPKQLEGFKDFLFESDWIDHNKELITTFYNLTDENIEDFRKGLKKVYNSEKKNKLVIPDVIVHKRGIPENFLVLEIKKKSKSLKNLYDITKLHFYRSKLDYKFAAFIQYTYVEEELVITIHWINDSENELKIVYELDETVYSKIENREFKNIEKFLEGISKVFETLGEKMKETPEQFFVQMSKLMDQQSRIKHDVFAKAIEDLEIEIGSLPIYKLADNLPESHKKNRYLYLLSEFVASALNTLSIMQIYGLDIFKEMYEIGRAHV